MKLPKQVSLKATFGLILVSILVCSSIFYYVWASAPSSTFWLAPGVYPGAPSFTVWREGNNYFAKNANGEIEFSGTNASQIVQNVVTELEDNGGKMVLKGTLQTSNTILVNVSGIHTSLIIEGEGINSLLDFTGTGFAMNITGNNGLHHTIVKDLQLRGGQGTYTVGRSGIAIVHPIGRWVTLENLALRGFDKAIYLDEVNTISIIKPSIFDGNIGIEAYSRGVVSEVNLLHIDYPQLVNLASYGIYLNMEQGVVVNIESGHFYNTSEGIRVLGARVLSIENGYFEDNRDFEINLVGYDGNLPVMTVEIMSCYFASSITTAINLNWAYDVQIEESYSTGHTYFVSLNATYPPFLSLIYNKIYDTNKLNDETYVSFELWGSYPLEYLRIPQMSHPNTATWGAAQRGRLWYCVDDGVIEYWNGTDIITP